MSFSKEANSNPLWCEKDVFTNVMSTRNTETTSVSIGGGTATSQLNHKDTKWRSTYSTLYPHRHVQITHLRERPNLANKSVWVSEERFPPSPEEAINLIETTKNIYKTRGIRLHQFVSNDPSVIIAIPGEDRAKSMKSKGPVESWESSGRLS